MPDKNRKPFNRRTDNDVPSSLMGTFRRDVLTAINQGGREATEARAMASDADRYNSRNQSFKGGSPTLHK